VRDGRQECHHLKEAMETPAITPHSYTTSQAEVVRLHDRYRCCLLDQKYYAWRLSLYQRWNTTIDLVAGITMILSLVTRPSSDPWLSYTCYAAGIIAALLFISKPVFKISEKIERYTELHAGYSDVFNKIASLVADMRRHGSITDSHRSAADELFSRCSSLARREDISVNQKKLAQFKEEVEKAVPPENLWLPPTVSASRMRIFGKRLAISTAAFSIDGSADKLAARTSNACYGTNPT